MSNLQHPSVRGYLFVLSFAVRNRLVFQVDSKDLLKFVLVGVIGVAGTNFTYSLSSISPPFLS